MEIITIEKNYKLICENLDKIKNGYNDGLIFNIEDYLDEIMQEIKGHE